MKKLTGRYCATQFTFWAASSGAASFATTFLLGRGVSSALVGTLLAAAGLLSCATQPVLASLADRSRKSVLPSMLIEISTLCGLCFAVQLIPGLPLQAAALFYIAGIWCSDSMVPLLNALSVSYTQAGYPIDYGVGRGIGSVGTALSSLALGYIIAQLGTVWMILFILFFRAINMVIVAGYPKIEKLGSTEAEKAESCSIWEFFARYRWYCASLLGILFLGMFHAMTENYLIAIMERLGGNSSHVGTALFISAMAGFPVIFGINAVRKYLRDTQLLKIAAVSFLIKAVLFYFAPNITTVYLLQLLQMTSYAFLAPAQVYYANGKIRQTDMVKGQAFITAAYALGCSCGNFAGGQLLPLGVNAMLAAGILMALAGTVVIFLTVNQDDVAE